MTLLRAPFLWASSNPFLAHRLPRYGFVRRAVRRFMPGETPEAALAEARRLGERGAGAILTLLGENATTRAAAREVVDHYKRVLERARREELAIEISVKPTHLGMDLGSGVAEANTVALVEEAAADGTMIWVDMESSGYVDRTLELFRAARAARDNVGICLQAYLRRTGADLEALLPLAPAIRLVKGAYLEPPTVAFADKGDVDEAFRRLGERLLAERAAGRAGSRSPGIRNARSRAHPSRGRSRAADRVVTRPVGGGDALRGRHARAGSPAPRGVCAADPGELRHPVVPVVHASPRRTAGERRVRAAPAAAGLKELPWE
jgi:proline dehydrogenase